MNPSRLKETTTTATTTSTTTTAEEKEMKKRQNDCGTWLLRGETCRGRWCPTRMRLLLLTALLFSSLTTGRANFEDQDRVRLVLKLHAPAIVDPRNDKVRLRCEYDLHDNELYSVNWYKNDMMLYRYSPSLESKGTVFSNQADVNVSLEHSNGEELLLLGHQDIRKNMRSYAGSYLCEVSTEKPFLTDYAIANVSVAILPKSNPVLEGVAHNYQVGEQLDAICTSAPSLPAAELTFYLNGQKIDRAFTQREKSEHAVGEAALTSRLSVSLRLERQHFPGGSLSLACRATLPGITVKQDYRAEKRATLTASNQRLAQEPPRLPSSSGDVAGRAADLGLLLLALLCSGSSFV